MSSVKKPYKWLGLLALIPAQGMIFMDQTILPVALPTIGREFNVGSLSLEWCVNAYLLFTAMFALIGGKIGDRISHKKTFVIGMIVFTIASILCGLAQSVLCLIGARALQGLGAALMIPSQIVMFAALFPVHERGKATGVNAGISSLFMILAPLIGGYLTEVVSWRAIFWINVPLAILGFILVGIFLPATLPHKKDIDALGLGCFAIGTGSATLLFMQARVWGWTSIATISLAILAVLSFVLLLKRERKAKEPSIDLALLKRPLFAAVNITIIMTQFTLMISVFRAIYFQEVLAYSAFEAGFITFIACLPVLFFSPIGGYLSDKFSPKVPIAIGYVLQIFSFIWLGFFSTPMLTSLLIALIAFGMGITLVFTPSYAAAMGAVPKKKMGVAFGMIATLRTLAATMGVALIGLLLDATEGCYFKHILDLVDRQRKAEIKSFSAVHFILASMLIIAFVITMILHHRKSAHTIPEIPEEGWD